MNKQQAQVAEFMRDVKGLDLPTTPYAVSPAVMELCWRLIAEEGQELKEAMLKLVATWEYDAGIELVDALADLLYVVYYACNAYGIDIEPIFDEVHRSNMTKKGGPKREDGKMLKPPTYEPPNLEPLIREQTNVS